MKVDRKEDGKGKKKGGKNYETEGGKEITGKREERGKERKEGRKEDRKEGR